MIVSAIVTEIRPGIEFRILFGGIKNAGAIKDKPRRRQGVSDGLDEFVRAGPEKNQTPRKSV
jgi:hypothetical protein